MKKTTLLFLSVALALGVVACANQEMSNVKNAVSSNKDVREVVYGQLPSDQKDLIDGRWEEGAVSTVKLKNSMVAPAHSSDLNELIGKEVYAIEFPIMSKTSLSNIVVFAEMKTNHYIGNGLVD
ncbi:MAG: hypothetical protein WCF60_00165 [Anaerobacillus sp.]